MANDNPALLTISLPDGRVARVPLAVLEQYVATDAHSVHAAEAPASRNDVSAHNLRLDESGSSDWHIEWELGPCAVTDGAGYPRECYAWHRHPYATEYAELYEG